MCVDPFLNTICRYYLTFDWLTEVVTIRQLTKLSKFDKWWLSKPMCIEGNSYSMHVMMLLRHAHLAAGIHVMMLLAARHDAAIWYARRDAASCWYPRRDAASCWYTRHDAASCWYTCHDTASCWYARHMLV